MYFTNPKAAEVFAEYLARHEQERALTRDLPRGQFGERRDEFLLPVGADVGNFLRALAIGRKPERILELGTSYGYSTLFLADAAKACGAKLVTVDVDAAKQDYARRMLERAGLAEAVEFRCGDALDIVAADESEFGLVLLDIWKNLYLPCFEAVYPKLAEEGLIVSDNMIMPESAREAVRAYREAVRAKVDLQTVLLPLGSGIELTIKWSEGNPKL
ncbi:MAG TPA: class I SAM-dependent methyltransferase [Croceibacterium sp.]|nr:class I SAM-dependent methyltransferase [Croceibacterium sp.]